MTVPPLQSFEAFFEEHSNNGALDDDRFVARNFRLDELIADPRAHAYAGEVLPAPDFPAWAGKHFAFVEDHLELTAPTPGPPDALDPGDPTTCPETFGEHAVGVFGGGIALNLSLVRVVGVYRIAGALGEDEDSVYAALQDPALRDGIIDRWSVKLPVAPVFATLWDDVKDLVPAAGSPPQGWADDLRDRLGLSFYDPEEYGPVRVVVLKYGVDELPTAGSDLTRPVTVPTVLDGHFFPPFCPAPGGAPIGRVVDLGKQLVHPWPELLHPTFRWRGDHVEQVGVIERPVPSIADARGRHLRLLQGLTGRPDYGAITDGDLL